LGEFLREGPSSFPEKPHLIPSQ